ncbi:MAG: AAA family ATPase, partial [Pseudomonadota bacterium]
VTVLFADLKGSMELLADRDPEEARRILDPVLERMMEAVHRYEGTVNQIMGDGVMALFGAPLAHEDHAVRACYAALAIQAAIRAYSDQLRHSQGIEIQTRIGLNSGEVVVRSIGSDLRMDYSAIGQTTHLASRMEQLATPGSTRLTADTLRLAEGLVQVTGLGRIPVKGLPEPIEMFELTGASALRTRLQAAAARGLTRFVGRQDELRTLGQALEHAARGHGQVVAMVGEPGVGKSRLVWEFTHSHRTQGWLIVESGSVSYGKATPYLPVIDLLKAYFQIVERDDARRIREKVLGKLLALDRSLESMGPAILSLLDVSSDDGEWNALDPLQRRRRTLDAVKRLLFRESQVQPLVLVFEDLHWIDTETQALLDSLIESLPTVRVLLLVNYRPEYQHLWTGKGFYTQLRLDALSVESAEELLQGLLGTDSSVQSLARLLIARTEGNPFFLEESVQTLVETGVLAGQRGAYRLVADHASVGVAPTVQALLAARIDRLAPEDKRLLQTAAVIGKDVPYALLEAIAEVPVEALHAGLARLQAAEFLYETSLYPDIEYTFKHALTHDVAYGSLLQERRKTLHAGIVEAIERVYANRLGEHAERLAYHTPLGELWDQAVKYSRQAGQKAFGRSANRDAAAWIEQALTALSHLPQSDGARTLEIDLLIDLRNTLLPLAEQDRMHVAVQRAERLAAALNDKRRVSVICSLLAFSSFSMGQLRPAVDAGQRALAIAAELADVALEAPANVYLGYVYCALGKFQKAKRHLLRNVEILEGTLPHELFGLAVPPSVLSRVRLMSAHAELGEFPEAIAVEGDVIKLAEAINQPFATQLTCWWIGRARARKGDFQQAIARLEIAERLTREWDIILMRPAAVTSLGFAYASAGQSNAAVALLDEALGLLPKAYLWSGGGWLGEGLLRLNRIEEASRVATDDLRLATKIGARADEAWALRLLGEIHTQADCLDPKQAGENYGRALALARELNMRPLVAHCHVGMGQLHQRMGRLSEARAEFSQATEMYRQMDMQFYLKQAEAALSPLDSPLHRDETPT